MTSKLEVKVTHRFKASSDRVYDAWLDPKKARSWMEAALINLGLPVDIRRIEIDPHVGGKFFFSDMRDGKEARHWGTYLELDRPRRIAFTWITDESEEVDPSKVTLTIEPDGEGCIANISHEMAAKWADYVPQTERGWTQMLRAVDSLLDPPS